MKKSCIVAVIIMLLAFVTVAQAEVMAGSSQKLFADNSICLPPGVALDISGRPLDSDQDCVPDYLDKCPNTPAGVDVDKDGCPGCPADSDNDGVIDCYDKCPNTPAGCIVDKDGCPIDSDKDGVPDCLDKCPNTPKGCIVDKDGCPIDSDKDGVPDCMDKCPNTPAGVTVDKNGCMHEKITINLNVEFDTDKAVIKEQYVDGIKKVADFMKEFPKTTAAIEGHTDNVGTAAYNERLSKKRASSVREYLIKNFGIKASRLTAKGYGLTKPIASNDTEEGRQKNRRVEAVLQAIQVQ